jgi:hypothetical protein
MQRKLASALTLALVLASAPAFAADGAGKISGRLTEIRPDGKLVIEEQGPWQGPGTGIVRKTVDLTPGTTIRVLQPTGKWQANDTNPGYDVQATDFKALRAGEFVTVTLGSGSMASTIDVMRTESEGGLASPPTEAIGTK